MTAAMQPDYRCHLVAGAGELAGVRADLRVWLENRGIGTGVATDVILAVDEAISNAIEHAGPAESAPVEVAAQFDHDDLVMLVSDRGAWKERSQRREGGRGFTIMRALVDEVRIETSRSGSRVQLRKKIGGSDVHDDGYIERTGESR